MGASGYIRAIQAAGAVVLAEERFGSYQGDWWAKVLWNGQVGWVHGAYGSCSGCDSFEASFNDTLWEDEATEEQLRDYQKRLADFGAKYMDPLYTQEQALKLASENLDWDDDAQRMVDFINQNRSAML